MGRTAGTRKGKKDMNSKGKTGCGCLVGILVIIMIVVGLGFHPISLRSFTKLLRYEDTIVTADAIFVPRFPEDKEGELFSDAFRQYFAGNGKTVYVEGGKVLGKDIGDIVRNMATTRGVKENVVRTIRPGDTRDTRWVPIKESFKASRLKKIIVIVPEYASRRYHAIYGSSRDSAGVIYIIKPLKVSYFPSDRWWQDDLSRALVAHEFYDLLMYYYGTLKKDTGK